MFNSAVTEPGLRFFKARSALDGGPAGGLFVDGVAHGFVEVEAYSRRLLDSRMV